MGTGTAAETMQVCFYTDGVWNGQRMYNATQLIIEKTKGKHIPEVDAEQIVDTTGFEFVDEETEKQLMYIGAQNFHVAGSIVLNETSTEAKIMHVIQGEAYSLDRQGMITHKYLPGDLIGFESFLDPGNRGHVAKVIAGKDLTVRCYDGLALHHYCQTRQDVECLIYRRICKELAKRLQADEHALSCWQIDLGTVGARFEARSPKWGHTDIDRHSCTGYCRPDLSPLSPEIREGRASVTVPVSTGGQNGCRPQPSSDAPLLV